MTFGHDAAQGAFAIVAGVMTLVKGEAWIGPLASGPIKIRSGVAPLIGLIAIALGAFLLFVP